MTELVVMGVGVRMAMALLFSANGNRKPERGNAAARNSLKHVFHAWNADGVQARDCAVGIRQKRKKRRGQHVAGGTGSAVEI